MISILHRSSIAALGLAFGLALAACAPTNIQSAVVNRAIADKPVKSATPNIIIIYVDDLGYADVGAYGAVGVETPHVDRLAAGGLKLTDAHSSSATCTPSRYSLLTGEYAFRANARVLRGDAGALIRPGKPTLPSMLKKAGYTTGVVGKWHLGLGEGGVDWNSDVKPGPLEIGFDYSFLLPATGDRVPTAFLDGYRILNLDPEDPITVDYRNKVGDRPTGAENPDLVRYTPDGNHDATIINGVSRIGWMKGGESALWVDEEFPDIFNAKAVEFIRDNKSGPFFLFYSFHDIHVPRLPHPRFQGRSEMGVRGDAIVQMDWMVGQISQELEAQGIADNTLIVFTSDNGPIIADGYADQAQELLGEHKPAGPYRGSKYSIFEAGTRVPTIVYWPAGVAPGESDALLSQTDLYASFADYLGVPLSPTEAIDSLNMMDAFTTAEAQGRKSLFYEAVVTVAMRQGDWKYIEPISPRAKDPKFITLKQVESGGSVAAQLYNLAQDPAEADNLAEAYPERVRDMQANLNALRARRTRD